MCRFLSPPSRCVKIPNAALRYRPDLKPDEMRAALDKAGISMGMRGSQGGGAARGGQGQVKGQRRPSGGQNNGQADDGKEAPAATDVFVVWKMLPDKKLEPVQIRTGITDHTTTQLVQVLKGQLADGDQVITGASRSSAANPGGPSPLGGGPRGPGR